MRFDIYHPGTAKDPMVGIPAGPIRSRYRIGLRPEKRQQQRNARKFRGMAKPGPARIEALYRYPVKGLTPEPLESVELATAVIPAQAFALVIPAGAKRRAGTQEQRGSGSRVSQGGSPGMTSKYRNKARACGRLRGAESHAPKNKSPACGALVLIPYLRLRLVAARPEPRSAPPGAAGEPDGAEKLAAPAARREPEPLPAAGPPPPDAQ